MKIGSVPLPMRVVCVSFALWLAGCGNTTRAGTDGGTGDATTTSDATRVLPDARAATDLGESCVGSCETRFESCTMDDTSCDTGICLFDARSDRADAYCTVGCPGGECPEGWECLEAGDGSGRFCLAESSVCGDGRIGRGEVCDPGPSVGTPPSGCSADCMDAFSAGSVSYDWDGFTQSVSGSSEGGEVRAEQITGVEGQTVVAVFNPGAGGLVLTLRIVVEGLTGPLPETALGQVRVSASGAGCFFNPGQFAPGSGNPAVEGTITVTAWENDRHLVGSFDGTVSYESCGSASTPPETLTHEITESRFEIYLEPAAG